jgi:hypothetical protein
MFLADRLDPLPKGVSAGQYRRGPNGAIEAKQSHRLRAAKRLLDDFTDGCYLAKVRQRGFASEVQGFLHPNEDFAAQLEKITDDLDGTKAKYGSGPTNGATEEIIALCDEMLTLGRAERAGGAPPPVGEYTSMSGPSGIEGRMGLAFDDEWDRLAKQFDAKARRLAQLVKALDPAYQTGTFYVAGQPKPLADFYPESAFNLSPSERKPLLEHVRRLNPGMDEARVAEVVKGIDELSASHARIQFTKPQWPGFVLQLQDRESKLHLHFVSPPQMVHAFEQRFESMKAWAKEHLQAKPPKGAEAGAGAPASGTAPRNTWKEVRDRLLALFRRGEQYTSLRELATRLNCAPGTVKKALESNKALQSWSQPASHPKGQALNEVVTDRTVSNREGNPADALLPTDVDVIMKRLISDKRIKPGIRSKLETMNSEQCRTVASWYNHLPEDADPAEMVATYLSQQQDCRAEATNAKGPKIRRRKV